MIEVNHVEYWRCKAADYEYLYHQQKNICDGYKEIIHDLIDKTKAQSKECKENIRKIEQNMV